MLHRVNDCPHFRDGGCLFAAALAIDATVPTTTRACEVCTADDRPRQRNRVTASLAIGWAHRHDPDLVPLLIRQNSDVLRRVVITMGEGPGTLLHRLLAQFGFAIKPDCQCMQWVLKMNAGGSEWCRQHRREISESMLAEFRRRTARQSAMLRHIPDRLILAIAGRLVMHAANRWSAKYDGLPRPSSQQ